MNLLLAMNQRIRDEFSYTQRYERGVQSPDETLSLRSGSCRDFAVLMMECVRTLGIAARFVSGYIYVPDLEGGNVGGGATHAWMQAFLPGAGWIDFDPTNSIAGTRDLIRVGVAWKPEQVVPLSGSFTGPGGASQGMNVSVTVTRG
jgi:transglutaminase-like putative cysteine protease